MGNQSSVFFMCYVSELSLKISWTNANNIELLLCWNAEWDQWGIDDDYKCKVVNQNAAVPRYLPLHQAGPLHEEFYKTLHVIYKGWEVGTKEGWVSNPYNVLGMTCNCRYCSRFGKSWSLHGFYHQHFNLGRLLDGGKYNNKTNKVINK